MGWNWPFKKHAPSPDQGPRPPKEKYVPGKPTDEVVAARDVLQRFWDPEKSIEPHDFPLLVAAARSEHSVLEGVVARLYREEVRKATDAGETDTARADDRGWVGALETLRRYGFTDQEVMPILKTLHP